MKTQIRKDVGSNPDVTRSIRFDKKTLTYILQKNQEDIVILKMGGWTLWLIRIQLHNLRRNEGLSAERLKDQKLFFCILPT